jgi:hypothetical protein
MFGAAFVRSMMSDGYDFFGTGAPSRPTPPVATWAPGASVSGGAWQPTATPPPARRSGKPLLAVLAVLAVAAVAASVFFVLHRSHPIRLPASAAGLPAITDLPSSQRHDIKEMEKQLGKAHVRDIHTAVYGDAGSSQALLVVGGHLDGFTQTVQQASSQLATALAGSSIALSQAQVSSGGTDFQCLWTGASGHVVSACYWWSNAAMLMGIGLDLDAERTADALGGVRAYAALS